MVLGLGALDFLGGALKACIRATLFGAGAVKVCGWGCKGVCVCVVRALEVWRATVGGYYV